MFNEYGHRENKENEEITLKIETLLSDFIEDLDDIVLEYLLCKKTENISKEN